MKFFRASRKSCAMSQRFKCILGLSLLNSFIVAYGQDPPSLPHPSLGEGPLTFEETLVDYGSLGQYEPPTPPLAPLPELNTCSAMVMLVSVTTTYMKSSLSTKFSCFRFASSYTIAAVELTKSEARTFVKSFQDEFLARALLSGYPANCGVYMQAMLTNCEQNEVGTLFGFTGKFICPENFGLDNEGLDGHIGQGGSMNVVASMDAASASTFVHSFTTLQSNCLKLLQNYNFDCRAAVISVSYATYEHKTSQCDICAAALPEGFYMADSQPQGSRSSPFAVHCVKQKGVKYRVLGGLQDMPIVRSFSDCAVDVSKAFSTDMPIVKSFSDCAVDVFKAFSTVSKECCDYYPSTPPQKRLSRPPLSTTAPASTDVGGQVGGLGGGIPPMKKVPAALQRNCFLSTWDLGEHFLLRYDNYIWLDGEAAASALLSSNSTAASVAITTTVSSIRSLGVDIGPGGVTLKSDGGCKAGAVLAEQETGGGGHSTGAKIAFGLAAGFGILVVSLVVLLVVLFKRRKIRRLRSIEKKKKKTQHGSDDGAELGPRHAQSYPVYCRASTGTDITNRPSASTISFEGTAIDPTVGALHGTATGPTMTVHHGTATDPTVSAYHGTAVAANMLDQHYGTATGPTVSAHHGTAVAANMLDQHYGTATGLEWECAHGTAVPPTCSPTLLGRYRSYSECAPWDSSGRQHARPALWDSYRSYSECAPWDSSGRLHARPALWDSYRSYSPHNHSHSINFSQKNRTQPISSVQGQANAASTEGGPSPIRGPSPFGPGKEGSALFEAYANLANSIVESAISGDQRHIASLSPFLVRDDVNLGMNYDEIMFEPGGLLGVGAVGSVYRAWYRVSEKVV
eukprot:gene12303-15460_t